MSESQKQGKSKTRSSSYPAISLERAVQNLQKVESNLGRGPFSRDSIAQALGYSGVSGTSGTRIAALVHYGLLVRRLDTYSVASLADEITMPRDESEKKAAIAKAAQVPKLFRTLLDQYSGRSLPAMLSHVLVRDHGIGNKVSGEVVKIFTETMTFAGLLTNGVLGTLVAESEQDTDSSQVPTPVILEESSPKQSATTQQPQLQSSGDAQMPLLPGLTLLYRQDLAFKLFTDSEFMAALQTLKTRAEAAASSDE